MAQPIELELPDCESAADTRRRIDESRTEHADAIFAALKILQGLHDRGVLDMAGAAIKGSDALVTMAVDAANSPEAVRGFRNLLILAKLLGSIEPETLRRIANAVPDALSKLNQRREPVTFFGLLQAFQSEEFRRGLAAVNTLLEAVGRSLSSQQTKRSAPRQV